MTSKFQTKNNLKNLKQGGVSIEIDDSLIEDDYKPAKTGTPLMNSQINSRESFNFQAAQNKRSSFMNMKQPQRADSKEPEQNLSRMNVLENFMREGNRSSLNLKIIQQQNSPRQRESSQNVTPHSGQHPNYHYASQNYTSSMIDDQFDSNPQWFAFETRIRKTILAMVEPFIKRQKNGNDSVDDLKKQVEQMKRKVEECELIIAKTAKRNQQADSQNKNVEQNDQIQRVRDMKINSELEKLISAYNNVDRKLDIMDSSRQQQANNIEGFNKMYNQQKEELSRLQEVMTAELMEVKDKIKIVTDNSCGKIDQFERLLNINSAKMDSFSHSFKEIDLQVQIQKAAYDRMEEQVREMESDKIGNDKFDAKIKVLEKQIEMIGKSAFSVEKDFKENERYLHIYLPFHIQKQIDDALSALTSTNFEMQMKLKSYQKEKYDELIQKVENIKDLSLRELKFDKNSYPVPDLKKIEQDIENIQNLNKNSRVSKTLQFMKTMRSPSLGKKRTRLDKETDHGSTVGGRRPSITQKSHKRTNKSKPVKQITMNILTLKDQNTLIQDSVQENNLSPPLLIDSKSITPSQNPSNPTPQIKSNHLQPFQKEPTLSKKSASRLGLTLVRRASIQSSRRGSKHLNDVQNLPIPIPVLKNQKQSTPMRHPLQHQGTKDSFNFLSENTILESPKSRVRVEKLNLQIEQFTPTMNYKQNSKPPPQVERQQTIANKSLKISLINMDEEQKMGEEKNLQSYTNQVTLLGSSRSQRSFLGQKNVTLGLNKSNNPLLNEQLSINNLNDINSDVLFNTQDYVAKSQPNTDTQDEEQKQQSKITHTITSSSSSAHSSSQTSSSQTSSSHLTSKDSLHQSDTQKGNSRLNDQQLKQQHQAASKQQPKGDSPLQKFKQAQRFEDNYDKLQKENDSSPQSAKRQVKIKPIPKTQASIRYARSKTNKVNDMTSEDLSDDSYGEEKADFVEEEDEDEEMEEEQLLFSHSIMEKLQKPYVYEKELEPPLLERLQKFEDKIESIYDRYPEQSNLKGIEERIDSLEQIIRQKENSIKSLEVQLRYDVEQQNKEIEMMNQNITDMDKKGLRRQMETENVIQRFKSSLDNFQNYLDKMQNRDDTLQHTLQSLLEMAKMDCMLQESDENDKRSMSLVGVRDETTQNSKVTSNQKQTETIQLDKTCITCSSQPYKIISAFKMACLTYFPNDVYFKGQKFTRDELIQAKTDLLQSTYDKLDQVIKEKQQYMQQSLIRKSTIINVDINEKINPKSSFNQTQLLSSQNLSGQTNNLQKLSSSFGSKSLLTSRPFRGASRIYEKTALLNQTVHQQDSILSTLNNESAEFQKMTSGRGFNSINQQRQKMKRLSVTDQQSLSTAPNNNTQVFPSIRNLNSSQRVSMPSSPINRQEEGHSMSRVQVETEEEQTRIGTRNSKRDQKIQLLYDDIQRQSTSLLQQDDEDSPFSKDIKHVPSISNLNDKIKESDLEGSYQVEQSQGTRIQRQKTTQRGMNMNMTAPNSPKNTLIPSKKQPLRQYSKISDSNKSRMRKQINTVVIS